MEERLLPKRRATKAIVGYKTGFVEKGFQEMRTNGFRGIYKGER